MDPRQTKINARRGYRERQLKKATIRKLVAAGWAPIRKENIMDHENNIEEGDFIEVDPTPNTTQEEPQRRPWWPLLVGIALAAGIIALIVFRPKATNVTPPTPTPTVETTESETSEEPVVEVTPTPETEEVEVVTPTPTVETTESETSEEPNDKVVACDTIQISIDGVNWTDAGEYIQTESVHDIGNRVVWTSRRTIVPGKAWNESLTETELRTVENTWIKVRLNTCETIPVIFGGGIRINGLEFNEGALFQLKSGIQDIELRNAELVLWFDQPHLTKDISNRVVDEILNGNFDITSRLGLAVTDSLKEYLPDEILVGVQIVIMP